MKKDAVSYSVISKPRSFLVAFTIIFVLVFGAASLIAYQHYKSAFHHTVADNKAMANLLATLVYEHQKAALGILESYASRPKFVDAVKKKDFHAALPRLKSLSERHTELDALFVTDPQGTLWADYPVDRAGFGRNLAYRDWYKGISRNWKPYVSTVYRLIVLEKGLAVALSVPVFDKQGIVTGILGSAHRTAFLAALIRKNRIDPDKRITLLDQAGNIVYSDTIEYEKEIEKYPYFPLIQATIGSEKTLLEIPGPGAKTAEELLAFSPVEETGWTVVVGEDKGALLRSERKDFIGIFSIAFLLFLCMAVIPLLIRRDYQYRATKGRLHQERILRESDARYKELFDNVHAGIAVYEAIDDGADFIFKGLNRAGERIEQVTREDIAGKKVTQVFPGVIEFGLLDVMRRVWQTGVPEQHPIAFYEDRRIAGWRDNTVYKLPSGEIVAVYDDVTTEKQAEEALKTSEVRYRMISQIIPDFIYSCIHTADSSYVVEWATDGFTAVTGHSIEEFQNRSCWITSTIYPEDRLIAERQMESLAGLAKTSSDFRIVTFDGRIRWIRNYMQLIPDEKSPEGFRLYGAAQDITKGKEAEEELSRAQEKFSRAFHASPALMAINTIRDGRYVDVNESFVRTLGYGREEAIGRTPKDLNIFVDDADRRRLMTIFEEKGEIRNVEVKARSKTGDERTGLFSASIIDVEGGQCWISVFEDVTERILAEDLVRQSEGKYRSIFENAMEGIFQTSLDGRFLSANPAMARMAGYDSPEDLISSITNMGEQLYVNPGDRARFLSLMEEKGIVMGFEVRHHRKDGSIFWALIDARAVHDGNGGVLYFEGTVEDITARKEGEQKLKETLDSLHRAIRVTIQTIASTVETKDPYTAGHQRRSTDLARAIAMEMGLAQDTVEGIRMAGSIHDIGKISIPAEILAKPTRLSAIEFELIKTHARHGYEILKDVESPWPLAEIILQHHERMDGSGYPRGLKGDDILIEARIIAVADVVESMASHRPYRPALGIGPALREIEENAGTLYDSTVAEVCLRLFREKGFAFE